MENYQVIKFDEPDIVFAEQDNGTMSFYGQGKGMLKTNLVSTAQNSDMATSHN